MHLLVQAIMGSRSRNLHNPNSDLDMRGVYVYPAARYWDIVSPPQEFIKLDGDTMYHEAKRYASLLRNSKTEETEMLFLRPEFLSELEAPIVFLLQERKVFVNTRLADSYRRSGIGMSRPNMSGKVFAEVMRRYRCMIDVLNGDPPTTFFEGDMEQKLRSLREMEYASPEEVEEFMSHFKSVKFDVIDMPSRVDEVLSDFLSQCKALSENL